MKCVTVLVDELAGCPGPRYNASVARKANSSKWVPVTRDFDIRRVLLADLRLQYSHPDHDLIVEEFGCKTARADVAVINGSLHAFEIKSDSDSLDRLPSQIEAYRGVFQYVTLVCGRRLLERARWSVPRWWGLQRAEYRGGQVILSKLRSPKLNPSQDSLALAKMLWKTEALACLRRFGHRTVTSKDTAETISRVVANKIPVRVLTNEVRKAIKARGGSGFARQSTPSDDLCTTESIAPLGRSSDLAWLLSVRSERHLH